MKVYKIILCIVFTIFIFVIGCSDRGVNYGRDSYELQEGTYFTKTGAHVFHNELFFQIGNKYQQMRLVGYWPKAAFPVQNGGEFKPVPMLILLPPQEGDENFYFQHGLKEIADELISKGIIQPMAILCLPNDQIFGGYFFAGSSPAAGFYDSLIGTELVRFAEEDFFATTIRSKSKRAIGGVGMGAYGAFRAAMLHPDAFSAVSGVAGPFDFDGSNGTSGLMDFFDDALNEQGLTSSSNLKTEFKYKEKTWPYSRLFIGGSLVFAIQDTLYDYTETFFNNGTGVEYSVDAKYSLDTAVFPLSSAITYPGITEIPFDVKNGSPLDPIYYFHLPFDNTGTVVQPVWDLWLANNLPAIFDQHPTSLNGINIWIGNSSEVTFGNYYDQTVSWVNKLRSEGLVVDEYNLKGYDGHPANGNQYVYDYLREMLIFHSEKFGN